MPAVWRSAVRRSAVRSCPELSELSGPELSELSGPSPWGLPRAKTCPHLCKGERTESCPEAKHNGIRATIAGPTEAGPGARGRETTIDAQLTELRDGLE